MSKPIYVTRPYLPPLSEFLPLLEEIWEARVLTNNGPFHQELEHKLGALFQVDNVSLVANGMLALNTAIEAAGLDGEVITTPYSFVATAHAVTLGRLTPVFVDIRRDDLNIDSEKIEAAITPRTSAIVAVHVYGNPCDVDAIEDIAARHGLKVIYDAAHAFGVGYRGRSILSWGEFAILSFHATKAFNTFEGGAVVSRTADAKLAVDRLRNFGIAGETEIPAIGGNAKMSEFNAALGLLQLKHFDRIRKEREGVDARYRRLLAAVQGIECLKIPSHAEPNYSYFPIMVQGDLSARRDSVYEALKAQNVYSRRYFYPLLSTLPMYQNMPGAAPENLPVATRAANEILCLPIYPGLQPEEQARIVNIIRSAT